jgi:DNA (cytosine-5)-methyltransferase 1
VKAATLFSGLGGSALGLQRAGLTEVFFSDFEPHAIKCLKTAFPGLPDNAYQSGDIQELDTSVFFDATGLKPGELTILQASPPCQSFSALNTSPDKNDDPRGELYKDALRFVAATKPKAFILENVPGFQANRRVFYDCNNTLSSLGYNVRSWVLDSYDYGSYQSRPRLWLVAYRKEFGVPTPPAPRERAPYLRDVYPDVKYVFFDQFKGKLLHTSRPVPTITKSPSLYFIEEVFKEPVPAGMRFTHRDRAVSLHEIMSTGRYIKRRPTIKELLTLSDFDPSHPFPPSSSYLQIHQRLGNAVLPRQMQVLAEHVIEELNEKSKN